VRTGWRRLALDHEDLDGAHVRPWSARHRHHLLGPRQPRELALVTCSAAIALAALATNSARSSRRSTARLAEPAAAHRPAHHEPMALPHQELAWDDPRSHRADDGTPFAMAGSSVRDQP
jgi:hypothetical protein